MKIISLNTWGGRAGKEKLLEFFNRHKDVDVFCLQEMWSDAYKDLPSNVAGGTVLNYDEIMIHGVQEISALLSEHAAYFHPHSRDNYGLLLLVSNKIEVLEDGEIFVHKHKGYEPEGDAGNHARNIQYVKLNTPAGFRTIINFHGLWNGQGKTDTPERLIQSDNIANYLNHLDNPYLLCGDFNLLPETESLKRLESLGLRNLIKEHGITSTRSSHYTKPEKFADYALASEGIDVKDFKILPDEVSDHLPLYVEIE